MLQILQSDHSNPSVKNCRHCLLRFKKSKSLLNLFIGELPSISGSYRDTIFIDLVQTQKLFALDDSSDNLPKPGFTMKFQKSLKKTANHSGELIFYVSFLSFTKDVGYFKDNMTLHATKATFDSSGGSPSSKKYDRKNSEEHLFQNNYSHETTYYKPAQIEIQLKLEAEKNFFLHLDDTYWRYFRSQEKKYFGGDKDPNSNSSLVIMSNIPSSRRDDNSQISPLLKNQKEEKVFLVLLMKKNKHKFLLESFETESMRNDSKLNKTLLSIGEIAFSFDKPEDLTSLINVRFTVKTG